MRRLNILLVMPRLVRTAGEGYQFPLGIAYVSASLKKAGFSVYTVNLNHDPRTVADILAESIVQHGINVVGTGGISIQYNTIFEILKCAKRIDSKVTTIVGGGLVTADPEVAMKALEYADIGVIGEAEITICDLMDTLQNDSTVSKVNGLIRWKKGGWCQTAPRQEIEDIDTIPLPDYDGFELEKYLELPPPDVNNLMEKRLVFFLGSRACPFNCTFCFHTVGRRYRQRSMKSMIDELDYLVERYKVGFVFMADELFGREKDRLREFCDYMRRKNLPWRGSFRVDDIDEESIRILKSGNCAVIGLGLESADNRILKSMRKHITVEEIEKALRIIFEAKIPFSGNFIFGDINETAETARNTLDWWERHLEYNINLWPLVAYPGSYCYQYACKHNLIEDKVKFLKDGCPAVNISKLSSEEMSWLARTLLESSFRKAIHLRNIEVISIDSATGRVTIGGECAQCGHMNTWPNIRLFISVDLACRHCAQKHSTPFPEELRRALAYNVESLLCQYPKIGIWGVTFHSIGLFEMFDVFRSPNVIPIDNVSSKQLISLCGKKVCSPEILAQEQIPLVISFYPNSTQQLALQIQEQYPNVAKIIDASDLIVASKTSNAVATSNYSDREIEE